MAKSITDTDFITYAHLSDDEYQIVYSIFFFYGDFGDYGNNDEYVYNHLVRLCEQQSNSLLRAVRVRQWISLLEKIIAKLEVMDKTLEVVVPYCQYSYNVEQTINHYQFARLVLTELLQGQFQGLSLIECDDIVETFPIPSIEELLDSFFESRQESLLPPFIYKFLIDGLTHFYVDNNSDVKCLEYIDRLFQKELIGEEQKAKEFLLETYKKYIGHISEGHTAQSFAEYIKGIFEFYILPFSKYVTDQQCGYVDWYAMKDNELSKRFYNTKGVENENKLYQGLFLDREIPLLENENQFFSDSPLDDIILDDIDVSLSNDEKTEKEQKKHGDEVKRVAVLYYMLKDTFRGDKVQMAKIISFALGVGIPENGRMANSSIYQYISKADEKFMKIEDYIKKELNRYKLPLPRELSE